MRIGYKQQQQTDSDLICLPISNVLKLAFGVLDRREGKQQYQLYSFSLRETSQVAFITIDPKCNEACATND